jgi:hypothetical protein
MYKLHRSLTTGEICFVIQLSSDTFIPFNPENRDYQEYLKWVAEGNTPEPADE